MLGIKKALTDITNRFKNISVWITKEYDKNGWHIREYSNGYAELWYEQDHTFSPSSFTAWGSIYTAYFPVITYPVTFAEVPLQYVNLKSLNGSGWIIESDNTQTATGVINRTAQLARPATSAQNLRATIIFYVVGKLGGVTQLLKNLFREVIPC